MAAIDIIIWWTGVVVWAVAGLAAMLFVGEHILGWMLLRLRLQRDFLLWVWERVQARAAAKSSDVTTEGRRHAGAP